MRETKVVLCLLWQRSDHLTVTWKVCAREIKVVFTVAGFRPPDGHLEGVCVCVCVRESKVVFTVAGFRPPDGHLEGVGVCVCV